MVRLKVKETRRLEVAGKINGDSVTFRHQCRNWYI